MHLGCWIVASLRDSCWLGSFILIFRSGGPFCIVAALQGEHFVICVLCAWGFFFLSDQRSTPHTVSSPAARLQRSLKWKWHFQSSHQKNPQNRTQCFYLLPLSISPLQQLGIIGIDTSWTHNLAIDQGRKDTPCATSPKRSSFRWRWNALGKSCGFMDDGMQPWWSLYLPILGRICPAMSWFPWKT